LQENKYAILEQPHKGYYIHISDNLSNFIQLPSSESIIGAMPFSFVTTASTDIKVLTKKSTKNGNLSKAVVFFIDRK